MAAACASSPPQQSGRSAEFAGAAAKEASSANPLPDLEFDSLLEKARIQTRFGTRADEITGLLHNTRAAVVPMKASLTGSAPSWKSGLLLMVAPLPDGSASVPLFPTVERQVLSLMAPFLGGLLAQSLDPLTRGDRGTGGIEPSTQTSNEDGATARVTTSLTSAAQFAVSGSRVQLTIRWTWQSQAVDKTTGKSLLNITDDRTLVGSIDVCPNTAGTVPITLNADVQSVATVSDGAITTRKELRKNTLSGHVDDHAALGSVSHEQQDQSSWESTSGGGGTYEWSVSGMNWGAGFESFDGSGVRVTDRSSGDVGSEEVKKAFTTGLVLDVLTITAALQEAQRLWRNGRCVVVMAPDYKAETPIAPDKQAEVRHDEPVEPSSETRFSTTIRHRFAGGTLNQPIQASLTSGNEKIQPSQVKSVPASLTYTAPPEEEKRAVTDLTSTSRRGIGRLVIAFHTVAKRLSLQIKGTVRIDGSLISVSDETIGPVEFTKKDDATYEAAAPVRGVERLVRFYSGGDQGTVAHDVNCIMANEIGTLYLTATIEKRGDTSEWVVHLSDDLRTDVTITPGAGPCQFKTGGTGGGGLGYEMLDLVGDIHIPIDGGTVQVQGTTTDELGTKLTAGATVTATVSKS